MRSAFKTKTFFLMVLALMVISLTAYAAENPLNLEKNALQGKKIGFVQLTLGTTYHAAMSDRFEDLCKIYGAKVDMVVSQNRAAEEQLSLAEDLLAKGVEVLVLNPIGDEIVPSVVKLCQSKKVPLICVDNTSPRQGYVYVGIDNYAIAREIGRYVGRKLKGPSNFVYVRSTATDTGCPALRFGGIMGGISDESKVSNVKLIDERYATKDVGEGDGMLQMEELLASDPKIDVVIGHHDAQSLGALTAIRNAGRKDITIITGFDGEKRMLEEIKKAQGGKVGGIDLVTGSEQPHHDLGNHHDRDQRYVQRPERGQHLLHSRDGHHLRERRQIYGLRLLIKAPIIRRAIRRPSENLKNHSGVAKAAAGVRSKTGAGMKSGHLACLIRRLWSSGRL